MPEYAIRRAMALLVTPVGLALISAVRLLIISNYNVTTAVTVAESGGYINTFLGSLNPLVPVLMPYLALAFPAFRRFILCALAIMATALISPVVRPSVVTLRYFDNYWFTTYGHLHSALPVIALAIVVCGLLIAWGGSEGFFAAYWVFTILWACAAVFALAPYLLTAYPAPYAQSFYAAYLRQPWLTAEQITVDPSKIYQGYVLSSDDQWMTVLLSQSRTIAYFRADSVTARIVCAPPTKPPPPPLVRLLNARSAPLPECRNSDSWAVAQSGVSSAATKTRINSAKTAAPALGTVGKVVSHPKRPACCKSETHGSHKVPTARRPHKLARDYRHRRITPGRRSTRRAGASPRSLQPGHTEVLSGELFLLCAAYRDKSLGELA